MNFMMVLLLQYIKAYKQTIPMTQGWGIISECQNICIVIYSENLFDDIRYWNITGSSGIPKVVL